MGWNKGYGIFEATVVGAYDLGLLNIDLLGVLMRPYADSDIDEGGSCDLKSKDGKSVKEIVLEVVGANIPAKPPEGTDESADEWDEYYDALYDNFREVSKRFGW